jgi:hypothetical protein
MASLADVFRVLEEMREARVFTDYAIGGATAMLFARYGINATIPDDV